MTVDYKDVCFVYDFDRLTSDSRLFDYGPHSLHATPGAAGAAPTRQLDGSYYFDGGDCFTLPLKFYQFAPTREMTLLVSMSTSLQNKVVFSTWNAGGGGTHKGLLFQGANVASPSYINFYFMQGGAGTPGVWTAASSLTLSRRMVHALTHEATPRYMIDQQSSSAAWVGGTFGTVVYDNTITPYIGRWSGGDNFVGTIGYLALINKAINNEDLAFYSQELMDGRKPWCWRK